MDSLNHEVNINVIQQITRGFGAIILISLIIYGCGDSLKSSTNTEKASLNSLNSQSPNAQKGADNVGWREQFEKGIKLMNERWPERGLKIKNYQYIGEISSSHSFEKLKQELLSDEAYFPKYSMGNIENITLVKKAELQQSTNPQLPYDVSKVKGTLDMIERYLGKVKFGKVQITWNYHGKEVTTTATVSDKPGFVYDNIISHVVFVTSKKISKNGNESQSVSPPITYDKNK